MCANLTNSTILIECRLWHIFGTPSVYICCNETIFLFLLNNISPRGISVSSIVLCKLFIGHRKRKKKIIYIFNCKIIFLKLQCNDFDICCSNIGALHCITRVGSQAVANAGFFLRGGIFLINKIIKLVKYKKFSFLCFGVFFLMKLNKNITNKISE
jgi:hypothetical protein